MAENKLRLVGKDNNKVNHVVVSSPRGTLS